MTDGPLLRPRQDSPGLSRCTLRMTQELVLPFVGCWTSLMVSTSRRSYCCVSTKKQISSPQRILCRGVTILVNLSTFLITSQVGFLQSPRLIYALPLHSGLSTAASFNLFTATKLKHLVFQCEPPNVQWITEALQTVEPPTDRRAAPHPAHDSGAITSTMA